MFLLCLDRCLSRPWPRKLSRELNVVRDDARAFQLSQILGCVGGKRTPEKYVVGHFNSPEVDAVETTPYSYADDC